MKRIKYCITLWLTFFFLTTSAGSAAAEQMWSEQYYRAIDYTGTLTEAEIQNIDENCLQLVSGYRIDAAGLVVNTADYNGMTLSQFGDKEYRESGFGYGETADGFLVVYDKESNEICVNTYGAATQLMTEAYVKMLETTALEQLEEYGIWGVLIRPVLTVTNDLKLLAEKGEYTPEPSAQVEDTSGNLPDWYPASEAEFVPFHNTEGSRVVDEAELFTPEEEASMAEKIREIQEAHGKDVVIYTSASSYGMERDQLTKDFYDYCGYGLGENHEGICLCLVTEPGSAGFSVITCGPETIALYTGEAAEYMDECFYQLAAPRQSESGEEIPGDYGAAVMDWLQNTATLFAGGALGEEASAPKTAKILKGAEAPEKGTSSETAAAQENSGASQAASAPETEKAPKENTGAETANGAETEKTSGSAEAGRTGMPDWYPEPGTTFVPFHNEDAPRVVDEADIFTPEEEAAMAQKIRSVQETHQKDLVIYTSNTSYGLEKEALASDFYDYCGYGLGENYEGMCLLFVMDPENRGFRVSAYGPETRRLYTQESSEFMDECLYQFVRDKENEDGEKVPGDYGAGVLQWLESADTLFTYGYAMVPVWYTGEDTGTRQFHDDEALRATAEYPFLLTAKQLETLNEHCGIVSEKLGIDIAVHVTNHLGQMEREEYAKRYFNSRGYGFGDTYDGMLLVIANNESELFHATHTYISGTRPESLTEVNFERLKDHVAVKNSGSYTSESSYKAAMKWLGDLEHMADTGRIARSTFYWIVVTVLSLIISAIVTLIITLREESKQKKPKLKHTAVNYTVANSLSVIPAGDSYVRTRKDKKYDPLPRESDRSSSSSSSSNNYNSSYSSSSGRSHTTSGRDF